MCFTIHLLSPRENKDFILELSMQLNHPHCTQTAIFYTSSCGIGEAMQGNMASQHLLDSLHCRMALMGTHKHFLMMTT